MNLVVHVYRNRLAAVMTSGLCSKELTLSQTSPGFTCLQIKPFEKTGGTLSQTSPGFTCLQIKPFEKTVGKGEIAHNEQFLLFPLCFVPVWRAFCYFHQFRNCRLQILSILTCVKFVVWERVNIH